MVEREAVERWQQLLKDDRRQADEFYFATLFPEVRSNFCRLYQEYGFRQYDDLLSLVGMSPEPVILFIEAVQPRKVTFLYTHDSEHHLDRIAAEAKLRLSMIDKVEVASSDPLSVYRAIRDFARHRDPARTLLDATTGKKAMVMGAVQAAHYLGIDVGYVDYDDYDETFRKPLPGSEYPRVLPNPLVVFGEEELRRAKAVYNAGNPAEALRILQTIDPYMPAWTEGSYLRALARYCQAWEIFDFETARRELEGLHAIRQVVPPEVFARLAGHGDLLIALTDPAHPDFLLVNAVTYYCSALRQAGRDRFDLAVLFLYRTVEQILELLVRRHGLEPSCCEEGAHPLLTEERYNDVCRKVFQQNYYYSKIPKKLPLMSMGVALLAIGDSQVCQRFLQTLLHFTELRNESIFTHGRRRLGPEEYRGFQGFVGTFLESFLERDGHPKLETWVERFRLPVL